MGKESLKKLYENLRSLEKKIVEGELHYINLETRIQ